MDPRAILEAMFGAAIPSALRRGRRHNLNPRFTIRERPQRRRKWKKPHIGYIETVRRQYQDCGPLFRCMDRTEALAHKRALIHDYRERMGAFRS